MKTQFRSYVLPAIRLSILCAVVGLAPQRSVVADDESRQENPKSVSSEHGSESVGDYFPLNDGDKYIYTGVVDGKELTTIWTTKEVSIQGKPAFYQIMDRIRELKYNDEGNRLMLGLVPGGFLFRSGEGIDTILVFAFGEIEWIGRGLPGPSYKKQRLFKFPPKIGDVTRVESHDGRQVETLTVKSFEGVTVPAGRFERCAKIELNQRVGTAIYLGYIWLAKGVGVVKFHRPGGKVDELLAYVPKKAAKTKAK